MNYNIKPDLEQLLETNIDAAKGYEKAAEKMENQELATVFNRLAQQRKLFNEEIINEVRSLGITPEADGTVKGYFHRQWMDVKDVFSANSDEAIIDASIEGENTSFMKYAEVIDKDILPAPIKDKVAEQKTFIFGAINQLEDMKKTVQ